MKRLLRPAIDPRNDVLLTSMQRTNAISTSVRRRYDAVCLLEISPAEPLGENRYAIGPTIYVPQNMNGRLLVPSSRMSQLSPGIAGSCQSRPRGYQTFIMLNSAEHEIFIAHKYKHIKNSAFLRLR